MKTRLASIRAVVLDVDGVLTDGQLHYGEAGEALKTFDVKDGMGIRELQRAGIEVAVISGRQCAALEARLGELQITHAALGVSDKATALKAFLKKVGVAADDVVCVGDDLPDLPMLKLSGIAACPADAHKSVRSQVDWVTHATGGCGAVREISDAIVAAARQSRVPFRVIIPSRYDSVRLPGKPLREIHGRPMIAHVWDRAIESGATDVVVATDDVRIATCVKGFGGQVVMTSPAHASGSDRIAEVVRSSHFDPDDIVVNLQGDEPAMPPECITSVAQQLAARPWFPISTLATPIAEKDVLFDANAVKVVLDESKPNGGRALYFSRAPIPWDRDHFAGGEPLELHPESRYLRHLGIYGYRAHALLTLADAAPTASEKSERLEQLRALALNLDIHVAIVKKAPPDGVDTESDLERIAQLMTS